MKANLATAVLGLVLGGVVAGLVTRYVHDDRRQSVTPKYLVTTKAASSPSGAEILRRDPGIAWRRHRAYRDRIDFVRQQPVDPSWAARTSFRLRRVLQPIADQNDVLLREVDCRRTGCIATLTWTSYDRAVDSYARFVEAPFRLPSCTATIRFAPEHGPALGAYEDVLLVECVR